MWKYLSCAIVGLTLSAAIWGADPYKLVLIDGTVVGLDRPPVISGATATLVRAGVEYTLPVSQIDLPASEKANPKGTQDEGQGAVQGPKKYTDDDLGRLRETSRLSSEGAAAPAAREPSAPSARKPTSDARLQGLYDKEDKLKKDRSDWLDRVDEFQEQYDQLVKEQEEHNYKNSRSDVTTTRGADQARWQKQQDARKARVQKDLAIAREKLKACDEKLEDIRKDIYREYDKKN